MTAQLSDLLATGELTVRGRFADASNLTMLVTCALGDAQTQAVFKPVAGMRPLTDFDATTLPGREVAAYLVSAAGGWGCVPTTVWRSESDFGPGSMQAYVHVAEPGMPADVVDVVAHDDIPDGMRVAFEGEDEEGTPVALVHADLVQLRRLAMFDIVTNNADRKGGHILNSESRLVGVDNGLTFHVEDKLRTVLWGWGGQSLLAEERELLTRTAAALASESGDDIAQWLSAQEFAQLKLRIEMLLDSGLMPVPHPTRRCIPWPVF